MTISFRRYIFTRKYHQGRGSRAGWTFVAYAMGDPKLPDAATWRELRAYLARCGADPEMLQAANIVWRSYISHVSNARRHGVRNSIGMAAGIVSRARVPVELASQVRSCASARE